VPAGKLNGSGWFAYNSTNMGPARLVFLLYASCTMDTPTTPIPPADDTHPYDQQQRAAAAKPNPNDPAVNADSPDYGDFGGTNPEAATSPDGPALAAGRSGANDNPDEFSEFHDREKDAKKAPNDPQDQPGHINQNQDTAAVRAAQHADTDVQREAWSKDDARYAGGGTHNTREESASTKDGQD
jgi:hypothetical protein